MTPWAGATAGSGDKCACRQQGLDVAGPGGGQGDGLRGWRDDQRGTVVHRSTGQDPGGHREVLESSVGARTEEGRSGPPGRG
jgi:hypothetical protein